MDNQTLINKTWIAMNEAAPEDKDAALAAYTAALRAAPREDSPEAIAEQKRCDEADYQRRMATKDARDAESHRQAMSDADRWAEFDASTKAINDAMDTEPSDI